MADKKPKKTFQDRLDDLTGLVEELERGELSLEDAIQRFEAGRNLHKELLEELDSYEKRIEKLVKDADGADTLEAVSLGGDDDTGPDG